MRLFCQKINKNTAKRQRGLNALLACVLTTTLFISAKDTYAQVHDSFCEEADSTAASMECVKRHHQSAQEKLNIIYEGLNQTLEGDALVGMRDLQNRWVQYRDQECQFHASLATKDSLSRLYELSCLAQMTQNRASLLSYTAAEKTPHVDQKKAYEFSSVSRWINAIKLDYPNIFWRYGEKQKADIDCDSESEIITYGITQASASQRENSAFFDYDLVVAFVDNPDVGRPHTEVLRFPIEPIRTQQSEGEYLCNPLVSLEVIESQGDGEGIPLSEGAALIPPRKPGDNAGYCTKGLKIVSTSRHCNGDIYIRWNGKEYEVEQNTKFYE